MRIIIILMIFIVTSGIHNYHIHDFNVASGFQRRDVGVLPWESYMLGKAIWSAVELVAKGFNSGVQKGDNHGGFYFN
jgi:hypothetical protein